MLKYEIKGSLKGDKEKNGVNADGSVSINGNASNAELVVMGKVLGEVVEQIIKHIDNDMLLLEFSKNLLKPIEKRVNN